MNISKIAGIFFLLIGLTYTIMAIQLPDATIGRPHTPKIFPTALGVLMIGLTVAWLVKESRQKSESSETSPKTGLDVENLKHIGLTAVFAFLYAILFNRVGYVLATIIFLEGILAVFNGIARWKQNTIVAVVFSLVVYGLFFKLLNVYLPPFPFFE